MTDARPPSIVGAYEHPLRSAPGVSIARLHAEVAAGALADAGLTFGDVDGYFTSSDSPGLGPASMAEYLGLNPRYIDTITTGGSAYVIAVSHAVEALALGRCDVALITLAGKPRSGVFVGGESAYLTDPTAPDVPYAQPYRLSTVNAYALTAMRHMYEYGTTSEQLAWVKVAASTHAQYNPHALLPRVVTVADVLNSPMISDPLHRLDCCVITDGGGALVLARPEIARQLQRPVITVRGAGEAVRHQNGGRLDIVSSAGRQSGAAAFAAAGVSSGDIDYASIYDSFTITVIVQLEDLGFCEPGTGGRFVEDGNLISGVGRLPVNTDGGGLCNNHPGGRGGMTKVIEAVRQLRGEAAPQVQVPGCQLAVVHAVGGFLSTRHVSATLILERT